MLEKTSILILAGPSGSGKNYITNELCKTGLFEQMPQVTTRTKREPNENTYYFINDNMYEFFKPSLIAKTVINNYKYGTFPLLKNDNKIGIIIANKMGIEDVLEYNNKYNLFNIKIIGIDSEKKVKRDDRNLLFVKQEKDELNKYIPKDNWLINTKERYINVMDVMQLYINLKGEN